ncbi:hypothetical protein C1I98_25750 [Spongiactinospora gelatinilytica]|uniref:DUF3040 domain-containing protein n=1 Tax=Spongiactinospora gelatinilytica TaxID=2666298 RepID=A0A2W2FJD4_9ACTN|nr:DUF3040 domain-containing protein [Spongiactinospora gelatinilytica]PZG37346.1 hypothetical protein C1I98_25750 [Spongiactinospora gelatinilytica]
MPLSEHEQRLLDQIEQALYAEDPKWANTVRIRDPRNHYKRRLVKASIGFLLGVVLLMVGVVSQLILLGVGGFVVMLLACLWGLSSWKKMNGFGDGSPPPAGQPGAAPPGRPAGGRRGGPRPSFMERMEERWRRRHDER